jgi:predicted cupin superfamily sugar epimerase
MGDAVNDPAVGQRVAAALGLEPLESEGGLFRRTYSSDAVTAIFYLVATPDFSALHRLRTCDELFFFHAGAPLSMLILGESGGRVETLGADPLAGQQPQLLVPAGAWQGASSTAGWSLVSTVVAPGFQWQDFELGGREPLSASFPHFAGRIAELTR